MVSVSPNAGSAKEGFPAEFDHPIFKQIDLGNSNFKVKPLIRTQGSTEKMEKMDFNIEGNLDPVNLPYPTVIGVDGSNRVYMAMLVQKSVIDHKAGIEVVYHRVCKIWKDSGSKDDLGWKNDGFYKKRRVKLETLALPHLFAGYEVVERYKPGKVDLTFQFQDFNRMSAICARLASISGYKFKHELANDEAAAKEQDMKQEIASYQAVSSTAMAKAGPKRSAFKSVQQTPPKS